MRSESQADISHMVSCPRPAWAFFAILLRSTGLQGLFPVPSGYSLAQGCFDACLGSQRPFSPGCEDTASVVSSIASDRNRASRKPVRLKTQFAGAEFFNGFRWPDDWDELKFIIRRDKTELTQHLLETDE